MAKKGKRNDVSVGLIRGNSKISKSKGPDVELFKELAKAGAEKEEIIEPVMLISRADYPVDVEYGERKIRVSPRSKLKLADASKLKDLPKNIYKKKLSGGVAKKSPKKVKAKSEKNESFEIESNE